MLGFSLFQSSPNDRAQPNALFGPVRETDPPFANWTLQPATLLNRVSIVSAQDNPSARAWGVQDVSNSMLAPTIAPISQAATTQTSITDAEKVSFNDSKLPSHAHVTQGGEYYGLVNRATKNPQFFLGDDAAVPSLLGEPQAEEFDLAVASQNVLDPTAAWWDNNVLAGHTESRVSKLADNYARSGLGIIATQESSEVHQRAFAKAGFSVINPDNIENSAAPVARCDTLRRQREQADLRSKGFTTKSLHAIQSWKRDWRGLNVFYKPEQYECHPEYASEFRLFSDENQKGWSYIFGELPRLIKLSAQSLWHRQLPAEALTLQYMRTRNAFSGVARKDGILVAHLKDKKTGKHVIVCDTHWESFDVLKRRAQRAEYIDEINHLRNQFPQATVVLAGDFNRPQLAAVRGGVAYDDMVGHFRETMNAHSMPLVQLTETYPGQTHLDGVYVIPSKDQAVLQTQGRTLKPYSLNAQIHECYEHFTDHSAVVLNARLGAK